MVSRERGSVSPVVEKPTSATTAADINNWLTFRATQAEKLSPESRKIFDIRTLTGAALIALTDISKTAPAVANYPEKTDDTQIYYKDVSTFPDTDETDFPKKTAQGYLQGDYVAKVRLAFGQFKPKGEEERRYQKVRGEWNSYFARRSRRPETRTVEVVIEDSNFVNAYVIPVEGANDKFALSIAGNVLPNPQTDKKGFIDELVKTVKKVFEPGTPESAHLVASHQKKGLNDGKPQLDVNINKHPLPY